MGGVHRRPPEFDGANCLTWADLPLIWPDSDRSGTVILTMQYPWYSQLPGGACGVTMQLSHSCYALLFCLLVYAAQCFPAQWGMLVI